MQIFTVLRMSEFFHQLEKLFSQSTSFQPTTLELFIRQSQETLSINFLVDDELAQFFANSFARSFAPT